MIFPLVLCLMSTMLTSSDHFVHPSFFFLARSFSSVGHLACGAGGARQFVSSFVFFKYCFSQNIFFVFAFYSIVSFHLEISSNLYVVPLVSRNIASYSIAHCGAHCIRGNVESLWRSLVTTIPVLLRGLKNRQGHRLCWMSTGGNTGLI